jgi:hypothetical protein
MNPHRFYFGANIMSEHHVLLSSGSISMFYFACWLHWTPSFHHGALKSLSNCACVSLSVFLCVKCFHFRIVGFPFFNHEISLFLSQFPCTYFATCYHCPPPNCSWIEWTQSSDSSSLLETWKIREIVILTTNRFCNSRNMKYKIWKIPCAMRQNYSALKIVKNCTYFGRFS